MCLMRKDLAIALGCVAFDVFCDKPAASQHRQLTVLWRKYSDQAKRSNKLVKRWQRKEKNLQCELDLCDTKSAYERTVDQMNEIEARIIKERRRLDEYAQCQGRTYSVCPRCAGTGIYAVAQCSSYLGHGVLVPTEDNVCQHLRHIGLGQVSEKLWSIELKPWFEKCLSRMYVESGDAARMLSEELHNEKD